MLHDIFYALLGFVGDIIVAEEDCYRVKDGFDLLRDAEREQINRIVQLGWFYTTFQTFIQKYDLRWGCMSDRQRFQTYKAAVSQALEDVLTEYVDDITYLEQLVAKEGNIPLSHIIQHLQKVNRTINAANSVSELSFLLFCP